MVNALMSITPSEIEDVTSLVIAVAGLVTALTALYHALSAKADARSANGHATDAVNVAIAAHAAGSHHQEGINGPQQPSA